MLRFLSRRLCQVVKHLEDGTILKGKLHPTISSRLIEGITQLPDGRVFNGAYDTQTGAPLAGCRLQEDGDLYTGEFNDAWQRHGKGQAWLADGTSYQGIFENDELVNGIVKIPQGTAEIVFEGTLSDEMFVKGRLSSPDYVYEGEFNNNEPDGKGTLSFTSGATQEGTFRAGKLHGQDCKMKLEGGFVYVGEFLDGIIRQGKLFTPTYTYEGEFNEHGRAEGIGTQIYHIHEPRLNFTGVWSNGAMIRGTVVDEYGNPVDWRSDFDAQRTILGDGDAALGEERLSMNSYCGAKLKEADELHRTVEKSYVADAQAVLKQTGKFPSKMDLRYEGGIQEEREASHRASQKQMKDMEACRVNSASHSRSSEKVVQGFAAASSSPPMEATQTGGVAGSSDAPPFDMSVAKINFSRQFGTQELCAQRAEEQLGRFLRSFPGRSKQDNILDAPDEDEEDSPEAPMKGSAPDKLNIDLNHSWKSFAPPPRS